MRWFCLLHTASVNKSSGRQFSGGHYSSFLIFTILIFQQTIFRPRNISKIKLTFQCFKLTFQCFNYLPFFSLHQNKNVQIGLHKLCARFTCTQIALHIRKNSCTVLISLCNNNLNITISHTDHCALRK